MEELDQNVADDFQKRCQQFLDGQYLDFIKIGSRTSKKPLDSNNWPDDSGLSQREKQTFAQMPTGSEVSGKIHFMGELKDLAPDVDLAERRLEKRKQCLKTEVRANPNRLVQEKLARLCKALQAASGEMGHAIVLASEIRPLTAQESRMLHDAQDNIASVVCSYTAHSGWTESRS